MARWKVQEVLDGGAVADVADEDDPDDTRCFILKHLERVSGGVEGVVGHAWVDEEAPTQSEEESYVEDSFDGSQSSGTEIPSLFDDPIALQLDEDRDDPDYEE